MEILSLAGLDKLGAFATLAAVAVLVITDKLVWHTRLKRESARADKWEGIAMEALSLGAAAGVRAAEVAANVVSALPDPEKRRNDAAAEGSPEGEDGP